MAKTFVIVLVIAALGATIYAAKPTRSYFRNYRHAQKRQAHYDQSGGNCEVTVTVGGGNGCNCACDAPHAAPASESAATTTAAYESEEYTTDALPYWSESEPVDVIDQSSESPTNASSGCGAQNPFCNEPFAPEASPAPAPSAECGPNNPFCDNPFAPEASPAPAPSAECGPNNPFCDNPFATEASAPAPPPASASHGSGTTSIGDDFCSHHYGCLSCGTRNPKRCELGDGDAARGQCFHKWSKFEFLVKHCQYHPVCNKRCSI